MTYYIERDRLMLEIEKSVEAAVQDWNLVVADAFEAMQDLVYAFPAADVRPVVFCEECKHKGWVQEPEHGRSVDYCHILERCVDKCFFCAAGERPNCGADMRDKEG